MQQDLGDTQETGTWPAASAGATEPAPATPNEGLHLLRAFRAIACRRTRVRILKLVDAEASRSSSAATMSPAQPASAAGGRRRIG